ncbi:MAG: hypothetical protein WCJ19_05135 [bacterium]
MFQIEANGIEIFLEKKDEIKNLFAKAIIGFDNYVLFLQDIKNHKTCLMTSSITLLDFIQSTGLPGIRKGDIWEIGNIMMRKQIIPYLKKG